MGKRNMPEYLLRLMIYKFEMEKNSEDHLTSTKNQQ